MEKSVSRGRSRENKRRRLDSRNYSPRKNDSPVKSHAGSLSPSIISDNDKRKRGDREFDYRSNKYDYQYSREMKLKTLPVFTGKPEGTSYLTWSSKWESVFASNNVHCVKAL